MKGRNPQRPYLLVGSPQWRQRDLDCHDGDEQSEQLLDLASITVASTTSGPQEAPHATFDQRATASTDRPFAPVVGRTGEHPAAAFFRRRAALRQRLLDQIAASAGHVYRTAPANVAAYCDALLAALLTVAAVEHQQATSTSVPTLNDSTSRSLPAVADQARGRAAHWQWVLGLDHVQLDPSSVREWLLLHAADQPTTPHLLDGHAGRPAGAPLRAG